MITSLWVSNFILIERVSWKKKDINFKIEGEIFKYERNEKFQKFH